MAVKDIAWKGRRIRKIKTGTVQINLGNRCNQSCTHCHIGASPNGDKNMDRQTATNVLNKLSTLQVDVEFTGGTPELNPNLGMFIEGLAGQNKKIAVRTSLTVLDLPEHSFFIDLYEKNGVKLIASLPSVFEDLTDGQRGKGVFKKSLDVLRKLNLIGYGTGRLALDLVYNPVGDYLPTAQAQVEKEYKQMLKDMHDVSFDNLITIVNSPITRFKNYLAKENKIEDYMRLLVDNFNPETLEKIMCRYQVSVDYRGHIYDCDFNLALGIRTKGYEDKKFWEIAFNDFSPEITCDVHCYACTVNAGSSCRGVLIKEETKTGFDAMENAKKYYGETLHGTSDLKTSACCTPDSLPAHVKKVLPYIAEEIKIKYYGCGSPIPLVLDGLRVLDLGCGTGRDTYVMSKLVGQNGFVYGLDMTEKQLEVARRYIPEQTARFGYERPNVRFIQDYIENAGEHFNDESLDLIISNCVIKRYSKRRSTNSRRTIKYSSFRNCGIWIHSKTDGISAGDRPFGKRFFLMRGDISFVVPVLRESERINGLIEHIMSLPGGEDCEIIVVDGSREEDTLKSITYDGILKISSPQGRGRQMNVGAKAAKGRILVFLHADTLLPNGALDKIRETLETHDAGAFSMGYDTSGPALDFLALASRIRARFTGVPYGDQAIFTKKEYFFEIGGYREIPLMEDVELMDRIKRSGGNICILKDRAMTSPRKMLADGILFSVMRNQAIKTLYLFGVDPGWLARLYYGRR
ncbi:MAG: arsenosugar biosynthesis radical SAM protein ArsS [Nitrospiraceae bacterium]|nr:arsenosugar biosynthesis radical SAM protein ArsS [Nitrospiraceae bacterium]